MLEMSRSPKNTVGNPLRAWTKGSIYMGSTASSDTSHWLRGWDWNCLSVGII